MSGFADKNGVLKILGPNRVVRAILNIGGPPQGGGMEFDMSGKIKQFFSLSINRHLAVSVFIINLILFICFGFLSFYISKINLEKNAKQNMNDTGSLVTEIISNHVELKALKLTSEESQAALNGYFESAGDLTERERISEDENYGILLETLGDILKGDPDIVNVWAVSEKSGVYVSTDNPFVSAVDYSLSSREWYRSVSAQGAGSAATHYHLTGIDGETGEYSIICEVSRGGNAAGYIGADVLSESLTSMIARYSENNAGYPIITDELGDIQYYLGGQRFDELFDVDRSPLLNVITQAHINPEGIGSFMSEKGGLTYYYVDNASLPDWSALILFDSAEMNGAVYSLFFQQLIILFCLMGLAFIITINVIRVQSKVIPEISKSVSEMAMGNYNYRIDSKQLSELGELARNIDDLARLIQKKTVENDNYANTDTLTGLYNRQKLYEHIEDMIESRKDGNGRFALMFIDIDNFKWLNETLSHSFGDAVLTAFAGILKESVSGDGSVFRFSGDEFIVIAEIGDDYDKINDIMAKLQSSFSLPLSVLGSSVHVKFSIGVSIYPNDAATSDLLLKYADLALHRSKEGGKDRVSYYKTSTQKNALSKGVIATKLNQALQNKELYLNYQPIISTVTGELFGFEVLVRWDDFDFGNVSPADFIKVAEETGEIVKIGTWIFESACRFHKELGDEYGKELIMSINVSAVQLKRGDYLEHIKSVIDITRVKPSALQIEITEDILSDFADSKNMLLNEISDFGVALALDDFGTGYSSLNFLKNFPIKFLKIDKSFIKEISGGDRPKDSIFDLVHGLGIKTIAEGTETIDQYNYLKEMKCDYIQGFLLAKPLDESGVLEFMKAYDKLESKNFLDLKSFLEKNEKILASENKRRKDAEEREKKEVIDDSPQLKDGFIISQ